MWKARTLDKLLDRFFFSRDGVPRLSDWMLSSITIKVLGIRIMNIVLWGEPPPPYTQQASDSPSRLKYAFGFTPSCKYMLGITMMGSLKWT
uniref:Uncharacterized protein n=1 Tax=Pyxicephalus adspersus TaxID=30357 RepID=A0AAV3B7S2_PYXAD|nr:TPA: hypothetical protein GDO54_001872 [Pyxicephalus adspersus]